MLASSKRESIPDVPAVYFLEPTPENIDIIVRDVNLASWTAYVNFSSTLPRALLEKLAEGTAPAGARGGRCQADGSVLEFRHSRAVPIFAGHAVIILCILAPQCRRASIQKTINAVVMGSSL